MTDTIARAAATDAGNRAMRAGGRTAWSVDDYDAAAAEYQRLAQLREREEADDKDAVRQTVCRYCDLEIEGCPNRKRPDWRDRGNNTHCPTGRRKHAAVAE